MKYIIMAIRKLITKKKYKLDIHGILQDRRTGRASDKALREFFDARGYEFFIDF